MRRRKYPQSALTDMTGGYLAVSLAGSLCREAKSLTENLLLVS